MDMSSQDYFNSLYRMKTSQEKDIRRKASIADQFSNFTMSSQRSNSNSNNTSNTNSPTRSKNVHSLTKTMTHSGHGKFELGSHITTQVYAYKTVKP
ncbi:unnamed protein product [Ambrosiozyma monospora]|uniref:Unnamed protein product n=1 Tax=Ambrosiozyma monospora TaxID=43982 RepID=A0ACB5U953_AMBMO|nr:unnamed protein product [Ambrosiozyma monospora]